MYIYIHIYIYTYICIKGKSYIKDSGGFIYKIKELQSISDGPILVASDLVTLYPTFTMRQD